MARELCHIDVSGMELEEKRECFSKFALLFPNPCMYPDAGVVRFDLYARNYMLWSSIPSDNSPQVTVDEMLAIISGDDNGT